MAVDLLKMLINYCNVCKMGVITNVEKAKSSDHVMYISITSFLRSEPSTEYETLLHAYHNL